MLRRLFFSKKSSCGLIDSTLHNEESFYYSFQKDLKHARNEVIIESPFIALKRTNSLLPALRKLSRKGVRVRVNTRNPRNHDKELRIQAWQSIRLLRDAGVRVKFYDDMRHRKLAVIDRSVLWEGSLNILSQSYSKEIMRRTCSEDMAIQMIRFTGMNRWLA